MVFLDGQLVSPGCHVCRVDWMTEEMFIPSHGEHRGWNQLSCSYWDCTDSCGDLSRSRSSQLRDYLGNLLNQQARQGDLSSGRCWSLVRLLEKKNAPIPFALIHSVVWHTETPTTPRESLPQTHHFCILQDDFIRMVHFSLSSSDAHKWRWLSREHWFTIKKTEWPYFSLQLFALIWQSVHSPGVQKYFSSSERRVTLGGPSPLQISKRIPCRFHSNAQKWSFGKNYVSRNKIRTK